MTLLETIAKASAARGPDDLATEFPIVLNPDCSLLKPKNEAPNPASLANPIMGWQFSKADSKIMELVKGFSMTLKRKLKDTNRFNGKEFLSILNPFLEKVRGAVGTEKIRVDRNDPAYTRVLMENVGFLMGKDLTGLVLEACVAFELWELVSSMIAFGIVERSFYPNLVLNIVAKRRSDLIVLCIRHASDLKSMELICILKYFLCPPRDAFATMASVRQEWEDQGALSIRNAKDTKLNGEKLRFDRDAAILLMIALDNFSDPELCLHYLLVSPNIDETVLSFAISKLNGEELTSLIRYLGKWLRKYERFPQAVPCSRAASLFGLVACNWVPRLEDVIRCIGLLLDENFSSLVLHSGFHEELRSLERVVSQLTAEVRLCGSMANVVESLLNEDKPVVV
ncbi:uncharacterized protein LOC116215356 [Punica granatum]|uniref:Uncharacterized protein n=2 Tax=Punica granatum TaxID=22663 RepID=A0A218VXW3_PUNGR|nr:uncharacterized protein LOC116215356 [Punica granatum]OWM65325.1 hypothetical protein CDL15_Pgr008915 [Punica granatum]PKI63216.1 hypothetical protein CRG98_016401 [Punica granatum]